MARRPVATTAVGASAAVLAGDSTGATVTRPRPEVKASSTIDAITATRTAVVRIRRVRLGGSARGGPGSSGSSGWSMSVTRYGSPRH